MRTQVAIIGAGPAGLMLSHLLYKSGVESVVIEQRSRSYVESRIRAGVLEQVTVDLMREIGVNSRMEREGLAHDGFLLACGGEAFRIDLAALTGGKSVMVYGQTEVTRDLIEALEARPGALIFEAQDVALHDITGRPTVSFTHEAQAQVLACDYIAGCDGFHGVSRTSIPQDNASTFERVYPFGWLGILADVPPCSPELIYANHERASPLPACGRRRAAATMCRSAPRRGWRIGQTTACGTS